MINQKQVSSAGVVSLAGVIIAAGVSMAQSQELNTQLIGAFLILIGITAALYRETMKPEGQKLKQ